ncbi:MAG: peptidylprolyl isomerase [Myxococcota bacterium]
MRYQLLALALVIASGCSSPPADAAETDSSTRVAAKSSNPMVLIDTTQGAITVELLKDKAPKSVENFLSYVKDGSYEGTIFHRVISSFMVQGGGFDENLIKRSTKPPVVNEANNGVSNRRGTVAMARTNDPNSATSQFFINVVDNARLDRSPGNPGYAVFGQVVKGMDTVDKIRAVPTLCSTVQPGPCDPQKTKGMRDVPSEPVKILKVTVKGG